jgi:hypothetical protein
MIVLSASPRFEVHTVASDRNPVEAEARLGAVPCNELSESELVGGQSYSGPSGAPNRNRIREARECALRNSFGCYCSCLWILFLRKSKRMTTEVSAT